MRICEDSQIELSALIDGELDAGTVAQSLDHVMDCPRCQAFWKQAREFHHSIPELSSPRLEAKSPAPRRRRSPVLIWAAAAAILLAIGLQAGGLLEWQGAHSGPAAPQPVVVELGRDGGHMTDERFIDLTLELLRADTRYHREMQGVLSELGPSIINEEIPESVLVATRYDGLDAEGVTDHDPSELSASLDRSTW